MRGAPAAAAAGREDAPGLDLLLEQPAQAAAAMAKPATPTTISRFTYCTPSCRWCQYLRSPVNFCGPYSLSQSSLFGTPGRRVPAPALAKTATSTGCPVHVTAGAADPTSPTAETPT